MIHIIRVPILLVTALALAGCSQTSVATSPTTIDASMTASITAPATVVGQLVQKGFFCPANPPGLATVQLVVIGGGTIVVTDIVVAFVDNRGFPMPQVTIPAPIPTTQFGSALAEARRTFPIDVRFGCDTGTTGTIVLTVHLVDAMGRTDTRQLTVVVL
jgi:hypothetical protein